MGILDRFKKRNNNDIPYYGPYPQNTIGYLLGNDFEDCCSKGYVKLKDCPEVVTACRVIAELISSMTIYLMSNTEKGDIRIQNELSRKIDINPVSTMTRKTWMEGIVMNMLLYGDGNAIVVPHTHEGIIQSLEPISASRVGFTEKGARDRYYNVLIDGVAKNPENLLHFVHNPDETNLWKGKGINVYLKDIAKNLKQAQDTENAFMASNWKPAIIVKVDSMIDEFSTPEGRDKILKNYVQSAEAGQPWLVPGEQFQVEQVKPLSLKDLAINENVELDKRTVAAVVGVPAFLLGVGAYNQQEWNNFIQYKIKSVALQIQQEMTKKLIISPKWYFKFNTLSLLDWDIKTVGQVLGSLYDKGVINGNEIRDRLGYDPVEGQDKYLILENYIGINDVSKQKKLLQGDEE